MEEISKRTAEAGGGLAAAAKAAALQNFVANQNAHRKRVWDGHALGMKALGFDATKLDEGEDVGDIIVTGDIYSDRAVQALTRTPPVETNQTGNTPSTNQTGNTQTTPSENQTKEPGILSKYGPVVLASLLGAGLGAGVPLSVEKFTQPKQPASSFEDTSSKLETVQLWKPSEEVKQGESANER